MEDELLIEDLEINLIDEEMLKAARKTHFESPIRPDADRLTNQEKIASIAERFREIMEVLGLDLSDESLQNTPYRVAKMYVEELFSGLDMKTFPSISLFEDRFQQGQRSNMVFVKVNFCSFCEHHFIPMNGTASIAYIPNGKLIGLSKIPRLVRFFAKRPQLQERLTAQIADALAIITGATDVAVSLCAQHHCMTARGIESENSHVITNVLLGEFETIPRVRQEFFDNLNQKAGC